MSHQASAVIKKKQRITVGVSKTNANRVKFGSHTLEKVLELEGHVVNNGRLYLEGQEIHLSAVDIFAKEKREIRPLKVVEENV